MFSAAHISVAFFPLTFAIRLWDSTDVEPVCLEIYIFLRIKGREGCTNIYRQNISKPDRRRIWEEKVAARINEEFFPLLVIIPLQIVHKSCVCNVFVYSCPAPLPCQLWPRVCHVLCLCLYPGPTIQSRSAARRAAQDLVSTKDHIIMSHCFPCRATNLELLSTACTKYCLT